MKDLISRQDAIETIRAMQTYKLGEGDDMLLIDQAEAQTELMMLPSAHPERLTDDDFETIRIHLNAYKEKLCNQNRWKEAGDYQRIIDRFMSFASAQPEIIRCKDCKHSEHWYRDKARCFLWHEEGIDVFEDGYCNYAERRTDE